MGKFEYMAPASSKENNLLAACPDFIIICHINIKHQLLFFSLKCTRFNHLVILWLKGT